VPQENAGAALTGRPPISTSGRALWDWAIAIAGLIYLARVFDGTFYSQTLGVVLVVLAAYEIIEPRCRRRGTRRFGVEVTPHCQGTRRQVRIER